MPKAPKLGKSVFLEPKVPKKIVVNFTIFRVYFWNKFGFGGTGMVFKIEIGSPNALCATLYLLTLLKPLKAEVHYLL